MWKDRNSRVGSKCKVPLLKHSEVAVTMTGDLGKHEKLVGSKYNSLMHAENVHLVLAHLCSL